MLVDAEPQQLSSRADAWGARIARLLGDPVLGCGQGDAAVATSEPASGERELLLRVRKGVAAIDVVDAIERAKRQRLHVSFSDVAKIERRADLVRLQLYRPSPRLPEALCEVTVPETGPFAAKPGRNEGCIELERRRGQGPRALRFLCERDPVRALGRLRHGEADILGHLPEAYYPDQAQAPATHRAFEPALTRAEWLSYLIWNVKRSPVDELDVRIALSEVLDRERLAGELHRGLAVAAVSGFKTDLADAAARLERAGFLESGAVRVRKGRLLRIGVLAVASPHTSRLLEAWRRAMQRVGAELEIVAATGSDFAARLREGGYDAALVERRVSGVADLAAIVGSKGAENFAGFAAPEVDAALAAWQAGAGDEAAVWESLLAQAPIVPIFRRREVALVSRALAGVAPLGDWFDLGSARWR